MWIRSQDKKHLLDVTGLEVGKVFGGKKKGMISAFMNSSQVVHNFVLAQYDTEKEALDELNRFEDHIAETPNEVFKFK